MNSHPFLTSLLYCFEPAIGKTGLDEGHFDKKLAEGLECVQSWRDQKDHPLLLAAHHQAQPQNFGQARDLLGGFDRVFVLGTGGSSLGGQALSALRQNDKLVFLDNIDPLAIQKLFDQADWQNTGLLVISKSGGTIETLFQCWVAQNFLLKHKLPLHKHMVLITEPQESVLRKFGTQHNILMLDHDTGIGGRFSVLSNVGMLPAALMGLNISKIKEGSSSQIDALFTQNNLMDLPALQGAALHALMAERGITQTVMMPYTDSLKDFSSWYCQLTAESLGKDGKGITPIRALGPVDQHSQLQLYLDGPRDKLYTILMTDAQGTGNALPANLPEELSSYAGKTIGDLCAAEARATVETLARKGCPTRTMTMPDMNEEVMGALFAHFMLETIFLAGYMNVNAFDQPAVEEGKILAKKYLSAA